MEAIGSPEWSLNVCTPSALRTLVETVSQVLSEATFKVVNDASFCGLKLMSIDHTTVCMVCSQFVIAREHLTGSGEFCVTTNDLITCLSAVDPGCVLRMTGDLETVELQARAKNTFRAYTVACIDRASEDLSCTDMETVYQIHVKSSDLIGFLNVSKKRGYRNMTIRINQTEPLGGRVNRYLTLVARDTKTSAQHTDAHIDAPAACTDIRLDATSAVFDGTIPQAAKVVYEETFSREYMSKFCRHVPSCEDVYTEIGLCGTGKPLILHVDLGLEKSYVRFVLASMVSDDE